ncbi:MAG: hypothetical protein LAT50_06915 [Ectothiorhodospiraceae bacterium]|nr:hypothetical protein [Ectothiorhodospiraceae bacterium]
MEARFTVFDTAIGRCGVVWRERQVQGSYLPERDENAVRARIRDEHPDAGEERAPEPEILALVDGIRRLMAGEAVDLSRTTRAMSRVPPFHHKV